MSFAYPLCPAYPSPAHAQAARAITGFFAGRWGVDAVLLTCSCARGKATRDSCLDIAVLVSADLSQSARQLAETAWEGEYATNPVFEQLRQTGLYSHVDLSFHNGEFGAPSHSYTGGADEYELEIGNLLAWSSPLWEGNQRLTSLRRRWLPYYSEELRSQRLADLDYYFDNNLRHIGPYLERGLYFQCFQRYYHALGEFLQALFIRRRIYPIAYDKWIREQLVEVLDLPGVYRELVTLLEISRLESDELAGKADRLRGLYAQYAGTGP